MSESEIHDALDERRRVVRQMTLWGDSESGDIVESRWATRTYEGRRARWVGGEREESSGSSLEASVRRGSRSLDVTNLWESGEKEKGREKRGERSKGKGRGEESLEEPGHCGGARYASKRPVASTKSSTAARALTLPTVLHAA